MACRILFSFSVCSTCFSFTTWDRQNRWLDSFVQTSVIILLVLVCWREVVDEGRRNSLSVCLISSWHSASCWPCAGLASPCRSCPSPMSSISQSHRAWRCSKMWRVYYGWTARHAKGIKRMLKQLIRMEMIVWARNAARAEVVRRSARASGFCSRLQI